MKPDSEPFEPASFSFEDASNWVEPPPPKAYEQEARPPLSQLILEAVTDAPLALKAWAEHVAPNLMTVLAFDNAKGMSEREAEKLVYANPKPLKDESRAKGIATLTAMPDQSLATHTLNAAMGAWTVVELANLSDIEQRLYLAGVTMHDLNKMLGTDVRLQGAQAEIYEAALKAWADRLGIWDLLEARYWPDIAFLAQNAEAVRGENRTLANYKGLQSDPADLEVLSNFVRLADLLASAAKHPDDVLIMSGSDKVKEIIQRVLRSKYVLEYHKTADNRGLLTQVIHNAVLEQVHTLDWKPFLYFPDGVTYLAPKDSPKPDLSKVPARVREMLVESVADKLSQLVTRGPIGMKFSPEFIALLTPKRAAEEAIKRIMGIIGDAKPPVTDARKEKTVLRQGTSLELDLGYGASLNADRLAEGLFGLSKLIYDYYGGNREAHGEALIHALDMEDYLEAFRAIEFTGGVGYPWYYIAGHYLRLRPGLSPEDVAQAMGKAAGKVIDDLGEPEREPPFAFLEAYVAQVLSMGGARQAWDFKGELARYGANKKPRSGQRICAICNSNFEVRADYSTFSNKQTVGYADAKRGICEICQSEKLLRRFTLGREMYADEGTKFLHLYPTFFFTPITAKVMRKAYDDFKNVVFTDIIKPYQAAHYDVGALLHADVFKVLEPANPKRRLDRVDYPEGQMHGYYLLGVPYLGRNPSDTENWVMPPLLGMLSPLLFGTKAVVSDSALPPYSSGADFPETVLIDSPHSFWQHGMKKSRFRLDELRLSLQAAISIYGVLSEAFKDGSGFAIWNQMGAVARALDSDPLAVFAYADRIASQQSKGKTTVTTTDGMTPYLAERLMTYYDHITSYYRECRLGGENKMGMIQEAVDKYAKFYRARGGKGKAASAFSRLRPLNLAIDMILRSPPEEELDDESLRLQINGVLLAFLDRIRNGDPTITAYIPKDMSKNAVLIPAVKAFTNYMVDEVFGTYCKGDRSLLRKRLNLLKNGCEAYYISAYRAKKQDGGPDDGADDDTIDMTINMETNQNLETIQEESS